MKIDLQKASALKRISAWLFDTILVSVIAVGFAFILSSITGYSDHAEKSQQILESYNLEYNVDLSIAFEEDYLALSPEEQQLFNDGRKALYENSDYVYAQNMMSSLALMMVSLSPLFGILVWEFIIPLVLKNGQTLGKKIFGICVIRNDFIQVSPVLMFIRTILGKFTIETMIPILIAIMVLFGGAGIFGTVAFLGIFALQICLLLFTENRTLIHDSLAKTVVVDINSQMIFPSFEEMMAYKNKMAKEAAEKAQY